jgi:hypothetical protein
MGNMRGAADKKRLPSSILEFLSGVEAMSKLATLQRRSLRRRVLGH